MSLANNWTLGTLGAILLATASAAGAATTALPERALATHVVPPTYRVTDVGVLGGAGTVANAINASGTLAGGIRQSSGETFDFRYFRAATPLGTLPGYSGSVAQGVNAAGQVTGAAWTEPGLLQTLV